MMNPATVRTWILLAAALALGDGWLSAQQPDTTPKVRRAVERLDRKATVRFAARGFKRPVTGSITRLTADSVYVQGFEWPVGLPLAGVDTVWEHVGVRDPAINRGFLVGGVIGGVLGAWLGYEICGLSESVDRHCGAAMLGGGFGFGLIFGTIGSVIAGVSVPPPRWEQRWP